MKLFLLGIAISLVAEGASAHADSLQATLTKTLLDGYETRSPPDGTVQLKFGMTILSLGLCPMKQVLNTDAWMKMTWTDNRLSWNATEWEIDSLTMPHDQIWIPDYSVFNGVNKMEDYHPQSYVVVMSNGMIIYIPAVGIKSLCQVDFETYPFGTQNCTMKIGSWTRDVAGINIVPWSDQKADGAFNFEQMPTNLIEIEDSSVKEKVKTYPCCPDQQYKHLAFNVVFKQKAYYHKGKLHTPANP